MSSAPVQRAITEAIESIASTEARVSILVRALGRAGLARVPERGPEVLRFVEGPLVDAIVERLGTGVADQIVEQLRPVLRFVARAPSSRPPQASSETRPPPASTAQPVPAAALRRSEPAIEPRPTIRVMDPGAFDRTGRPDASIFERAGPDPMSVMVTPVPPPAAVSAARESDVSGARPRPPPTPVETVPAAAMFILASLDDALVDAVERVGTLAVRSVRGLFELVDAAEDARDRATTLVFDCSSPPVHIASLLALAADMPATVQVALLGASQLDLQALASAPERTVGWVYLERLSPSELTAQLVSAARASAASTG